MFPPIDALLYYAMIRSMRPKKIIEIGSGYSTLIAAKAALKNDFTKLISIEPYPIEFFNQKNSSMLCIGVKSKFLLIPRSSAAG